MVAPPTLLGPHFLLRAKIRPGSLPTVDVADIFTRSDPVDTALPLTVFDPNFFELCFRIFILFCDTNFFEACKKHFSLNCNYFRNVTTDFMIITSKNVSAYLCYYI